MMKDPGADVAQEDKRAGTGPRVDPESLLKTSKVVCMAPWVHAHLSSLGDFTPCCEIFEPLGESKGATLVSHWNSPAMAAFRLAMLKDAPIPVCRKCYDKEAAGVVSRRQRCNEGFLDEADRLAATGPDGRLPAAIQPIDLDLRFSNLCNFRCRSCWHGASSRWFSDALALGLTSGPTPVIMAGADREKTLAEVMKQLPGVRSIYFAGGEPLLMEEHYVILEELIRIGHTDIRLSYNTNLSELHLGDRGVTDLWRAFPDIWVGASADGMGPIGELVRKGIRWARFEENVHAVRRACPHVQLSLAMTVSVFNIFHLPEFYFHLHNVLGFDHEAITLNPLQDPVHYNIGILPRAMKRAASEALTAMARSLPASKPAPSSARGRRFGRDAVLDLVTYIGARDERRHIPEFVKITERLDALRGEDSFITIPELALLRTEVQRMRTPIRRAARLLDRMTGGWLAAVVERTSSFVH